MSCFPDFKNQHNRYSSYSKILIDLPLVLIQLIGEYEGYVDFLEAIQFLQNKFLNEMTQAKKNIKLKIFVTSMLNDDDIKCILKAIGETNATYTEGGKEDGIEGDG